jgi:DNA-binding NarL/FixJ family response regulator
MESERLDVVENLDRSSIVALDSAQGAQVELKTVWPMFVTGGYRVVQSFCTENRCYGVLRCGPPPRRGRRCLMGRNVELIERILLGDSQKLVSLELGLAPSTVALIVARCLRSLGLDCHASSVPMLLVMAVHAFRAADAPSVARRLDIEHGGQRYVVISARRPDAPLEQMLSGCEYAVARLRVEGRTHAEIAQLRQVSPRTVANQLTATFQKLRVSGRADLLRELLCRHARPSVATARAPRWSDSGRAEPRP